MTAFPKFPTGTSDLLAGVLDDKVPEHTINNILRRRAIAAPRCVRGRRWWTATDALALVEALDVKLPPTRLRALRAAAKCEGDGRG